MFGNLGRHLLFTVYVLAVHIFRLLNNLYEASHCPGCFLSKGNRGIILVMEAPLFVSLGSHVETFLRGIEGLSV